MTRLATLLLTASALLLAGCVFQIDETAPLDSSLLTDDDDAGDDDTTAGDDDTSAGDDASAGDDDTAAGDDDTSVGDDDTALGDDDVGDDDTGDDDAGDDDTGDGDTGDAGDAGDDDAGDDDTALGDDDTGDDDTAPGDDDAVPATCSDDGFEPNDSTAAPTNAVAGTWSAVSCPGNDDVYAITVAQGDSVTASIAWDGSAGSADLTLLDDSGGPLDFSAGFAGSATVGPWSAPAAGIVLLRVSLGVDAGAPGLTYSITVDATATTNPGSGDCAAGDAFEPNDDLPGAAWVLPGIYTDLSACPANPDYFTVTLFPFESLGVDLWFSHGEGDVDVYIADDSGMTVDQSTSESDNESIFGYTAWLGGDYVVYVELYGDAGAQPGNSYEMDLIVF